MAFAIPWAPFVASVIFAVVYKMHVVDKIPPLDQRPISVDEDLRPGICECTGDLHLCLHSWFCCWCRAAHTWHVAGVCEYWPALCLLFLASSTCVNTCVSAYFRMKLKDKLGIRRNACMDVVYSLFCPCCAVGQEALGVDAELGSEVECCCRLISPPAIGISDPNRSNLVQLKDPNNNYSNNAME